MSFADEVQKNYTKAAVPKKDSFETIANTIVHEAKHYLMEKAKRGRTLEITQGLWGKKVKVVCYENLRISHNLHNQADSPSLAYNCPDYDLEKTLVGFDVNKESEAKAIFNIIQRKCNAEGINVVRYDLAEKVRHFDRSCNGNYLRFWITL